MSVTSPARSPTNRECSADTGLDQGLPGALNSLLGPEGSTQAHLLQILDYCRMQSSSWRNSQTQAGAQFAPAGALSNTSKVVHLAAQTKLEV